MKPVRRRKQTRNHTQGTQELYLLLKRKESRKEKYVIGPRSRKYFFFSPVVFRSDIHRTTEKKKKKKVE